MDQKTAPPQQQQQGEVCVSGSSVVNVWRGIMNWLGFLVQLFVQILRGTPSMAQMLVSYVLSLGYLPLLYFSSPESHSFKPLPVVEIPLQDITPVHPSSNLYADVTRAAASDSEPVEKLTVVLDLDETLVCSYESSTLPGIIRTRAIEAGLKWFKMECVSPEKDSEGKPKMNYITVFERPGLHEFLKQIHEFSDLVLFTAGVEGYARPLVDRIDTEYRFSFRLYRPSTVRTEHREHVKDLSCLSKDLCRIVIVDNNPFSFLLQPLNGIPCVPFSAGQPYDDHLLDVLLPLLKDLSMQKDVRPTLYERFHMPEWFQMHGIPASRLMA